MPTPGTDVGPFDSILDVADPVSHLGGYDKQDKPNTTAYPGTNRVVYAREHNRIVGAIDDLVTAVNSGAASASAVGYIDITKAPYLAVGDGATDNYATFVAAIAYCKANPGWGIYVPKGTYLVKFNAHINDATAGKHRYLLVDFGGFRLLGDGMGQSIIRGETNHTAAIGRVASLSGNTLTFQTASDAANVTDTDSIRITSDSAGLLPRTIGPGSISVLGPVTANGNGNGTTGAATIRNDGGRFSGVVAGDYIWADKGFALFRHEYSSAATTARWDFTVKDLTLDAEVYGAVVDPTGDANPILDCPTYLYDANPQPMGNNLSLRHRVEFDHVQLTGGYTQIHAGAGGTNSKAQVELVMRYCDSAKDAMSGVYFGCNDAFNGRSFVADHTDFHDLEATMASHLTYINSACSISANDNWFDGWRSSNYACQHWGGSSTYAAHATWANNKFGTRSTTSGGGYALLTSEHGQFKAFGNTFESASGIQLRCGAQLFGNLFRPGVAGGTGVTTYLDCQHNAQMELVGNRWNLVNIVATGWQGAVVIESPVKMRILGGSATSTDINQDSDNLIVPGNTGAFLVIQTGSTGGHIYLGGGFEMRYGTASGASNVSWLVSATGASGAAFDVVGVTALGRPANDRGMIQCQNRTSSDKITVNGNDFTVGTNNSVWFYSTSGLPAGVLSGRDNKTNGAGAIFVTNRQNMRGRAETGPDIAIASRTITWNIDYDFAHVTGTGTDISTLNLILASQVGGACQLGYHGMVVSIYAVDGFTTDTAGNFAAVYALAAGSISQFRYDATITKWVRQGAT